MPGIHVWLLMDGVKEEYFKLNFDELKIPDQQLVDSMQYTYYELFKKTSMNAIYKEELYEKQGYDYGKREALDGINQKIIRKDITHAIPLEFDMNLLVDDWYESYFLMENVVFDMNGWHYTNIIDVYSAHYDYSLKDKEAFKTDLETDLRNSIGDGIFADGEVVEFVSIEEYPHKKHTIFLVTIKEPYGFTSKQYYIMGDKKFAMVEKTTNQDIPIYDETVLQIIDSLEWREPK